jgi:hypothetical protein
VQHFNPLIEMVLEKRRNNVTSYDGHHGLKVLVNTLSSDEHQFDFTQFILSIGCCGRLQLMSLIRKEIDKLRTKKIKNEHISNISDIDFQSIAEGLLELFGLIQSQPSPSKKRKKKTGQDDQAGDMVKISEQEPTFPMEYNNTGPDSMIEDVLRFEFQQPQSLAEEQNDMPKLCVEFFDSIVKNNLVSHVRQNWFAFPMYNADTGAPLKGRPILLFISDDYNWQSSCDCKMEHEAKLYHNQDQSGFEKNQCWHSWIMFHTTSRQRLLQLKLPHVVNEICYLKLLNGRPSEHLCFVYAFVASTNDAILSVTSGKVRCSVCHNGARQLQGEKDSCDHGEMLWNHLKPKSNCDSQCIIQDDEIEIIRLVYESKCADSAITYNLENNTWMCPSLSYTIEVELNSKFGKKIDIPPWNLDDKSLRGTCKLSRDNIENYGYPVSEQGRLQLIPEIIAKETPLFKLCNCVYRNSSETGVGLVLVFLLFLFIMLF